MKSRFASVALGLLVAVISDGADGRRVFRSPDGVLIATIASSKQMIYGINPSRIEIRDRKGHLLAERDHSFYPSQGLTVENAAWTKNSAFFVYSAEQSGGHQPWAHPTFLFSRKKKHFYSLDEVLKAPISGPFQLKSRQTLVTEVLHDGTTRRGIVVKDKGDGSGAQILTIKLDQVGGRLNQETLSTDHRDRLAKKEENKN